MFINILLSSALFIGNVFASPVKPIEATEASAIQERASSEGLHLVNCELYRGCGSYMYYYTNDGLADANHAPSDYTDVNAGNSCVYWPGRSTSGKFQSSGVTFTATINSDADSKPLGTRVGTGYNGSKWYCYKDNGHAIYSYIQGKRCSSEYYCLKQ